MFETNSKKHLEVMGMFLKIEGEGENAIKSLANKLHNMYKDNAGDYAYYVVGLNWLIRKSYEEGDEDTARIYDEIWREADKWACDKYKGDDALDYYTITD